MDQFAHDPTTPKLEFLTELGLVPPVTVEDVKQAYLEKAKSAHPDRGGDPQRFIRLQAAFEEATAYAKFKAGRMQWLSEWVEQYAEQGQLVDEIKALGGSVDIQSSDALTKTIGPDFAAVLDRLIGVRLTGPKIDDAVILQLSVRRNMLSGLRRLALIDTQVSSVGLTQLRDFESLRQLDLSGTRVGPHALEALVRDLPRLELLVLRGSGVGWWARWRLKLSKRGLRVTA